MKSLDMNHEIRLQQKLFFTFVLELLLWPYLSIDSCHIFFSTVLSKNRQNWENWQILLLKYVKMTYIEFEPRMTKIITHLWKIMAWIVKFACNKSFVLLTTLKCCSDNIYRVVGNVNFLSTVLPKFWENRLNQQIQHPKC